MLQGSLENFALDEVLGLLSGTSKTGQLEIAGNRGTGSLSFDEGRLVDAAASYTANGTGLEDVMFELLRYGDGTFTFTNGEVTGGESPENVASVLASAENRLRDWRSIEAVVPTLNHQVTPSTELPSDEVTITRSEWAALIVIGAGCPVSLVCDRLELGEVEGSRQIKNLAERELIIVTEPIGGFSSAYRASNAQVRAEIPPVPTPAPVASSPAETVPTPIESFDPVAALVEVEPTAEQIPAGLSGLAVESGEPSYFSADAEPVTDEIETTATTTGTTGASSALESLIGEQRPPMPPVPGPEDFIGEQPASESLVDQTGSMPAPPSPAEISSFSAELEDASELVDSADEAKSGGLLARYLKNDD